MPTCANMCHYVPTWANIAVCQLCTERHPMRNSRDGLDQCHGICSHEFTTVYITKVIYAGLPVDINVSLWLRKQRPKFSQTQLKGYFQTKKVDRTTEAIVPMNEMWRKLNANMRQYVSLRANMGHHCSLQLCRERTPFRSHGTSLPRLAQENCHTTV